MEISGLRPRQKAQHRPVAAGVPLFRQAAAAAGRGDAGKPVFPGQFQLLLAAAPADAQQARSIHKTLFLGGNGRQAQRAERAQEHVLHAGITANDVQGVPALRHGALPKHLSRRDDAGPKAFHMAAGMAQQENLAVHAGVERLAEMMLGALPQQFTELLANVNGINLQPVDTPPPGYGGGLPEERRIKMQAAHTQPLILQQPCGQNTVQPAGKKHNGIGFRAGGVCLMMFHRPHFYEKAGLLARRLIFDMDSC